MKVRYGMGRVEYLANKPKIQELLTAGLTRKMIFEQLKLHMSYRRFCCLIAADWGQHRQKKGKDANKKSGLKPDEKNASALQSPKRLPQAEEKSFSDNSKIPSLKELTSGKEGEEE